MVPDREEVPDTGVVQGNQRAVIEHLVDCPVGSLFPTSV
jgi:hypothetical protein